MEGEQQIQQNVLVDMHCKSRLKATRFARVFRQNKTPKKSQNQVEFKGQHNKWQLKIKKITEVQKSVTILYFSGTPSAFKIPNIVQILTQPVLFLTQP